MYPYLRRNFQITEVRVDPGEGEDTPVRLTWRAAVFDSLSEDLGGFKEKIGRRAFTKTLAEHDIRALFNHDPNYVLGRNKSGTLSLSVDTNGLNASVEIPPTQWARDLITSVERGDINAGSFAFQPIKDTWGQTEDGTPLRTIQEARLFDVSLVSYPAYPATEGTASVRSKLAAAGLTLDDLIALLLQERAGTTVIPPVLAVSTQSSTGDDSSSGTSSDTALTIVTLNLEPPPPVEEPQSDEGHSAERARLAAIQRRRQLELVRLKGGY